MGVCVCVCGCVIVSHVVDMCLSMSLSFVLPTGSVSYCKDKLIKYGVATISRLLENISLFCKRAL